MIHAKVTPACCEQQYRIVVFKSSECTVVVLLRDDEAKKRERAIRTQIRPNDDGLAFAKWGRRPRAGPDGSGKRKPTTAPCVDFFLLWIHPHLNRNA
jgi:hypothetical protein